MGRNARWPLCMLTLVSHGEYAVGTDRQTDGPTGTGSLHYTFR